MDTDAERFRRAYWAVVHRLDTLRLRAWEAHGLSLPKLRILLLLLSRPGTTAQVLVAELGVTAATVSELVEKLVQAGFIERGQQRDDRRRIPLSLTAEGLAVVGEIRLGNRVYLTEVAELLSDDLLPVTTALERLLAAMDQHPAVPERVPSGTMA